MLEIANHSNARLADLDQLIKTTITAYVNPVPSRETLRAWFDAAKVRRFKANPQATRGGGTVFYYVADVEKLFSNRLLTGRLATEAA